MLILVKVASEIITKTPKVRSRFQNQLYRNCEDAFAREGLEAKIIKDWGRFYIESQGSRILEVLPRVFGIHSFSVVEHGCAASLNEMVAIAEKHYAACVEGKTFAVRTKRAGKHEYSSYEVSRDVGSALNRDKKGKVNLRNPEFVLEIDIVQDQAYFFSKPRTKGSGGLPLKTAGHAVCLMSGGFDSPYAAYLMQKRGVSLEYVFCNLAGKAYERSVLRVTKQLAKNWSYGLHPKIHVIDFEPLVQELRQKVKPAYVQVVLKRLFYRVAEKIAMKTHSHAIVTGEAISQVSSQTLKNLRAIEVATDLPVLRPLVATDKEEIIDASRFIGTYEISASIKEYCQLVPDKPITAAQVSDVDHEESKLDLGLIDEVILNRRIFDLQKLTDFDLTSPYVFIDHVPSDAQLLDCRSAQEAESQPLENAVWVDFDSIMSDETKLDRNPKYVLVCEFGTQSALLAEAMQSRGFEAYSLQGGVRKISQVSS